jgi:hypothetical protein
VLSGAQRAAGYSQHRRGQLAPCLPVAVGQFGEPARDARSE